MQGQDNKEKLVGIVGTSAFHVLLIAFLLFSYLQAPSTDQMSEWGGVPVMFGNVPDAFGNDEPFGGGGTKEDVYIQPTEMPTQQQDVAPAKTVDRSGGEDPIATQDLEQTIAINEAENKAREDAKRKEQAEQKLVADKARKEASDRKAAEDARIAQQKAEDDKKKQIGDQMAGLFGNGTGSGSRGETHGEGTQGIPTGNASFGKTTGVGGWGEFDLGGRSLGRGGLIKPNYSVDDYGTVVVDIIVNPQGSVLEASIGKGTNTPSSALKQEAIRAARQTRFNVVTQAGNQKGKITYKFNLN